MFLSVVFILKIRLKPKEELLLHHAVLSFQTIRGLEQKSNKMYVLDMDEKGNLYLYKFVLLCKNEIIKRLINGSYHLAEASVGPSIIGNSHGRNVIFNGSSLLLI